MTSTTPKRDGWRLRQPSVIPGFGLTLGFTLAEISQMIEAQSGRADAHTLKLNAEKCLQQIAFFERQMREAAEALTELREIHLALSKQAMERVPKA